MRNPFARPSPRRPDPKRGRMAGTRARGPTPEPPRIRHHLAVVSGVLLVLGTIAASPHLFGRAQVAVREAPFLLEKVHTRGLDRVPAGEIAARVASAPGTPLVDLDTGAIEARLESHPWIAAANVARQPPGTLRIHVEEHVPLAVTPLSGTGAPHVVNQAGVPFAPAAGDDVDRLVAIVLDPPPVRDESDPRLVEALRIAASLRARGLAVPRQLRLGLPRRDQSAELRLRGFAPAVWIDRVRHDEQLDRLATLLTASLAAASEATVIDLRFQDRAVLWSGP